MLQKTDANNNFRSFMFRLLSKLFEKLGLQPNPNDGFMDIQGPLL
jgi:hypothetical protein